LVEFGVGGFGTKKRAVKSFAGFILEVLVLAADRDWASRRDGPARGACTFTHVVPVRVTPLPKSIETGDEKLDLLMIFAAADVAIFEFLDKPGMQEQITSRLQPLW
jgi:hypothetical protein